MRSNRPVSQLYSIGDNYYLGMEFPREYDEWKTSLLPKLAPDLPSMSPKDFHDKRRNTQRDIALAIDMLWYEAALDVMSTGDVFNPGGRSVLPSLRLINSPLETRLSELKLYQSFGLDGRSFRVKKIDGDSVECSSRHGDCIDVRLPTQTWVKQHNTNKIVALRTLDTGETFDVMDTFDILKKGFGSTLVRTSMGYVARIGNSALVRRRSDLARSPDG